MDRHHCSHGLNVIERCALCDAETFDRGLTAGLDVAAKVCDSKLYANLCCATALEEVASAIRAKKKIEEPQ